MGLCYRTGNVKQDKEFSYFSREWGACGWAVGDMWGWDLVMGCGGL